MELGTVGVFLVLLAVNLSQAQVSRPGVSRTVTSSQFTSDRMKVSLSCDKAEIAVHLNFSDPFHGVAQAGPKARGCSLRGDGGKTYVLNVPLESCGTCVGHSCPSGTFVNTLSVRYHPTLELDGDEVKTIICKFGTGSVHVG